MIKAFGRKNAKHSEETRFLGGYIPSRIFSRLVIAAMAEKTNKSEVLTNILEANLDNAVHAQNLLKLTSMVQEEWNEKKTQENADFVPFKQEVREALYSMKVDGASVKKIVNQLKE